MLEDLAPSLAAKVLAWLPGWLLRRVLTPGGLADRISVDLRGNAPGSISANGSVPQLDLWFRITNHSAFPVVLDRLDLEVWYGQPFARLSSIERRMIPAHADMETLRVTEYLSGTQLAYLKRAQESKPDFVVQTRGYFTSKLGWTGVSKSIARRDFPISLGS